MKMKRGYYCCFQPSFVGIKLTLLDERNKIFL